jgi:hypothetical protein
MRRVFAPLALTIGAVLAASSALSESEVTRTSRPIRLLRSWEEPVKVPGRRDYVRRVELVFDYDKGVARESYYALDGRLIGSREIKQNQPQPSREEIDEAQELILRDAGLARIIQRRSAALEGGFLLEEGRGRPCGPGTRCVQIQLLTPDHSGLLRWTVVDLVKREIRYPVYVPRRDNP